MFHYVTAETFPGLGQLGKGFDAPRGVRRVLMAALRGAIGVLQAPFRPASMDRYYEWLIRTSTPGMPNFDEARQDFKEAVAFQSLVNTEARL